MNHSWMLLAVLGCSVAMADSNNDATIDNSGKQYNGVVMINQAGGDHQQLSNYVAIAVGRNAQANVSVTQKISGAPAERATNAKAAIQGNSFSNGNGVVSINQSAGAQNQMINAVRISVNAGPQSIDDSVMSQQNVALATDSGLTPATGSRQVVTSDQAFTGSRGVVQVNQSAGVGNRVANTLNLRLN
ncbi:MULTISPECIES: adhesin [Pseudomonas]|uniref:adhesin n=1 Tax=Pseudomonas TaxID=286 RepID=UPI000CFA868B|nr:MULTISPECIES: adhesin [Pseudomonas]PQZ84397.1 adhesin [Pseudomonas trivialis]PRB20483.1 adhesin [Pseudomonas sp. MYb60]